MADEAAKRVHLQIAREVDRVRYYATSVGWDAASLERLSADMNALRETEGANIYCGAIDATAVTFGPISNTKLCSTRRDQ
jgi:hypothetical protein